MSKVQMCQLCPSGAEPLPFDLVITGYEVTDEKKPGKTRIEGCRVYGCALCVENEVLNRAPLTVFFTTQDRIAFFQELARTEVVRLEVRRGESEKMLCSNPTCENSPKESKPVAVSVRGKAYPLCGCCSNAAHRIAKAENGPFPMSLAEAQKAADEFNAGRTTEAVAAARKLLLSGGGGVANARTLAARAPKPAKPETKSSKPEPKDEGKADKGKGEASTEGKPEKKPRVKNTPKADKPEKKPRVKNTPKADKTAAEAPAPQASKPPTASSGLIAHSPFADLEDKLATTEHRS